MNKLKVKTIITVIVVLTITVLASACNSSSASVSAQDTEYVITKVSGDIDWNSIPVASIDNVLWTDDYGIRAKGQLCYDEDHLYVHLSAVEKNIRAENTEPLSPVWEDSCLEFFFSVPDSDNYFNFEINPNGCLLIQYGPERTDRINIVKDKTEEYFDIHTARTDDGWEVYYAIPLKFLRLFYPEYSFSGDLNANMYKCGDLTENAHYLSWKKIELDSPNFHCPEYFGKMHFDG